VLIYGEKDFVAKTTRDLRKQAEDYGHSVQYDQEFAPHPTEPFGFADGISQPAIRGTRPARSKPNQNDIVEAGELVLGYPDNIGRFPPTPSVSADADPARLLSNVGEDPYRQRPEFSRTLCGSRRDLGRNGTFLVVRQLEQDVDAFDEWLNKASSEFACRVAPTKSTEHVKEMIAAKIIGRWKNGTPLVRHPHAPGPHPKEVSLAENDFNFGEEDPAGLRCPLGAHIRRANPRDSLTPGSSEQLAAVNRHRILRVGRRYDAQDGKHPGLLFMCVNVDIERQFEFIQQRWLVNPSFHGLPGETDASLSSAKFTVPTEHGPVQLTGLHQFVTTRGGAYFFLPSRTALQFLAKLGSWGSYKIDPPIEATAASVP
jgi:Dyp-type peroxidase family